MAEPFAKSCTWRNVLEPDIDPCFLLGKAPWPQPVNKDAHPVRAAGFFIDPLDFNSQGRPSSPPSCSPIASETRLRVRRISTTGQTPEDQAANCFSASRL